MADNNRMPCGQGAIDWEKLMQTLDEVGYQGCVTVEFVATVDRAASPSAPRSRMRRRARERRAWSSSCVTTAPALSRPSSTTSTSRTRSTAAKAAESVGQDRLTRTPRIALIATLDTKGEEVAYVRDRIRALGGRRW